MKREISVVEPVKHSSESGGRLVGGQNAYTTYRIASHLTPNTVENRKRFSDFEALHSHLSHQYPSCIIPPLPSKQRMGYLDRFDDGFVEKRRVGLELFLNRVLDHPTLGKDKDGFLAFLSQADWIIPSGSGGHGLQGSTNGGGGSSGPIDSMTDSFMNAFSKVRERDSDVVKIRDERDVYLDNLINTEKNVGKLVKLYEEMGALTEVMACEFDHSDFTFAVSTSSPVNEHHQLNDGSTANTVDLRVAGLDNWVGFLHSLGSSYGDLGRAEGSNFQAALAEQIGYCHAVKETLKLRDQKQIEYESLTDYLKQTKAEQERLLNPGSGSGAGSAIAVAAFVKDKYAEMRGADADKLRQDRIKKLEAKSVELAQAIEASKLVSASFSEEVKHEAERFQQQKEETLKEVMLESCQNHVRFYQKALQSIDDIVAKLE